MRSNSALAAVALALLPTSSALVVSGGSASTRRAVVQRVAGMAVATPLAAWANTEAILKEPMQGFENDEAKRAAFVKKQKAYKKQWRAELNNFEYASNDAESMQAIEALAKMVLQNGDIPEGVRKMDLDQVYKRVKPNLGKQARSEYLELEGLVRKAVTVKDMRQDDP